MESCPAQAVLPLVGLAAEKVIRERYIKPGKPTLAQPPKLFALIKAVSHCAGAHATGRVLTLLATGVMVAEQRHDVFDGERPVGVASSRPSGGSYLGGGSAAQCL
ncbi:MAG: hypothetical protein ACQESR_10175 [Planctomycetota bacterium]